jgi:hypothetical protein
MHAPARELTDDEWMREDPSLTKLVRELQGPRS